MRRTAASAVVAAAVSIGVAIGRPAATSAQTPGLDAFQQQRVERMLENRLACRGCHVVAGRGGRIGPSLDGLAERADAEYVRAVLRDPATAMPGTSMPSQRIPEPDLDRLAVYLLSHPAGEAQSPEVTPQAPPALPDAGTRDGAALYARHCAACHGPSGEGDGWNAPTLPTPPTRHADAELMSARTDDTLFDAIYAGAFVLDGSPWMPPFGAMLTAQQIRSLVAHIRTLCDCEQPAWAGSR